MSSQKTTGVASAPMTRWRWRRKRTSSRRASETAGSRMPRRGSLVPLGRRVLSEAMTPSGEAMGERILGAAAAVFDRAAFAGRPVAADLHDHRVVVARDARHRALEHADFLDLVLHARRRHDVVDEAAVLRI